MSQPPYLQGAKHDPIRALHRRQADGGNVRARRRGLSTDGRFCARLRSVGEQGGSARGDRKRFSRAARLGVGQPAAPRPRADEVQRAHRPAQRRARRHPFARTRQDAYRRQGRHPARRRSARSGVRRRAHDEGRIYRRGRPRHRHLFHAPAARRCRRHHAVQLPGDDPIVEAVAGDRLRQRLRAQAERALPRRTAAPRRTLHRGGRTAGHPQRRQRRQRSRRRYSRRSRYHGGRLRRLDGHRRIHLRQGHGRG